LHTRDGISTLRSRGVYDLAGLPAIDLRGLSWDGQSFLVLWTVASNTISCVQGQLLDPNGFVSGAPMTISSAGANATECAGTAGTNHFVVWMESTELRTNGTTRARVVDSTGILSEMVTLSSVPAMSPHPVTIAWGKDRALAVWDRETGPFPGQIYCAASWSLTTNSWLMLYGRMQTPMVRSTEPNFRSATRGVTKPIQRQLLATANFLCSVRQSPCQLPVIAHIPATVGQQISLGGGLQASTLGF